MTSELTQRVIDILCDMKQWPSLGPDEQLLSSGRIDSFDLITLTMHIEEELGVAIRGEDISAATFGTARSIATLLSSYGNSE